MPAELLTEESILRDCPRMSRDDRFAFRCGKDLPCFNQCCRDVSIVLTPYDVLRLKKALGLDSSEFLTRYAIAPFTRGQKFPVPILRMNPEGLACPFVTPEGCGVYADRPWACRMYPLGVADPRNPTPKDTAFHFLIREDFCAGHDAGPPVSVRDWTAGQGAEEYEMMGASFKSLTLDEFWDRAELTPAQTDMFYMACYDLDRFRRFVFETRFLDRFIVDEARVEALRSDDDELLEFAMQWLRFCLFKEKTMKIRQPVEARR
ncbi:MAG: YkgJ family cysteine cluster protein [Bryobacteraceae bacterium]|nr:YkgJ family cysteine cluster protein [Bryobacteraceae bacterium]